MHPPPADIGSHAKSEFDKSLSRGAVSTRITLEEDRRYEYTLRITTNGPGRCWAPGLARRASDTLAKESGGAGSRRAPGGHRWTPSSPASSARSMR